MTARDCDTLIVGGGLSGLYLASMLAEAGHDFLLVEGRARFGGRILSTSAGPYAVDLGPAWFWPGQPLMADLTRRLGLSVFAQFSTGRFRFENARGEVSEHPETGSMQGSLRISGGMPALVDVLRHTLPRQRLLASHSVESLRHDGDSITADVAGEQPIVARRVVLALPPRLAAQIAFTPELPLPARAALAAVPTWMAGQAKATALYDRPFWRDAALSGDAMSQHGPLVEIHDASPADASAGALFGFIGLPPKHRRDETALRAAVTAQLARLFGPQAATPRALHVKDWVQDPLTATAADHAPLRAHPRYGLPDALRGVWDGALLFSGSETDPVFGGYLEGALGAARTTFQTLLQRTKAA